jgi:dipeptidyl aminopeptidase/acylaminoacyl peptidase
MPGFARSTRTHLVAALLVIVPAAVVAQGAAFGVDDLLKIRRMSDPQISADGRFVAFVLTEVDQAANTRNNDIWIVPLARGAAGKPALLIGSPQSDDRPRWSPDGTRLAWVSSREGGSQIWIADVRDGAVSHPRKLTSMSTEAAGATWSPDGKWLVFVSDVFPDCGTLECNASRLEEREKHKSQAREIDGLLFRHWTSWKDGRFSHLFLVPADGSAPPRDLTPGKADAPPFSLGGPEDYALSPDGRELAFARKTDPVEAISTNSDLFVVDLTTPGAQPRKITPNGGADGGPVYSPDGKFIAYRAQARAGFESDLWRLMIFDRASGSHRSVANIDRHVESFVWTPDASGLLATIEDEGAVPLVRFDVATGTMHRVLRAGSIGEFQLSKDGRTVVYAASSLKTPTELFRVSADGSGVEPLTRLNDKLLEPFRLRAAESVSYPGAAGAKVQAWIVKPPSFREGTRYPLLLLIHGGPQSAWNDGWSFRWNAQVFANAGYIVFMPNPRGSTGFGQKFIDDISRDWGGKVYEDLMRGADYAEALPYVDRTRTAAAGASYGGYMVNWILGHTDRFKALVSHAGLFNLHSMYGVTEELWFPEWEFGGTPYAKPELYDRWSPHHLASRFKTPTLVTHGELDFRVPIGEGLQVFTALQRQGVPSKLLYFPDEGHWILKPANSAVWYRTVLGWLSKWLGGREAQSSVL